MPIEGISHITLLVRDLERSADLLKEVFDAKEVYDSGVRQFSLSREKFFILGGIWVVLMEGRPLSERSYNHIALKIPARELAIYKEKLEAKGVEFMESRSRVNGEGQSLYFYDYDNHLIELHTGTLDERLDAYDRTTLPSLDD